MAGSLTVHNAEVKTATVEIKTLTISGKQVTLAVFRQLREEPVIAADGTLNGVPWGVVNYHPDKCAAHEEHLHVVWQHGTDLYRSRIDEYQEWPRFCDEGEWGYDLIQAAFCLNGHREPAWARGAWFDHGYKVRFVVEGMNCVTYGAPEGPRHDGHKCGDKAAYEEAFSIFVDAVRAETDRRARYRRQRDALADLPQLFIAV